MLAWKIAPAIAAGNTVVLKPAEFTSLTLFTLLNYAKKRDYPKVLLILLQEMAAQVRLLPLIKIQKKLLSLVLLKLGKK